MQSIRNSPIRFTHLALVVAALGLNVVTAGPDGTSLIRAAHAQAAEKVRPEVAKPLQAAQEAIRAGKYKDALNRLHDADAIGGKTSYETYMIDRTRGAAAMGAGDNETAGRAFEAALGSGRVAPGEQAKIVQALSSLYYRAGDYPKAIVWLQRALKDGLGDGETRMLLAHSYFQSGDLQKAQKELQADMAADEKAGRAPSEVQLKMMANIAARNNDTGAYLATLERQVANYPTKEAWTDLLQRTQRKPGFADRLTLDVARLKMALGQLTTTADYMESAQLALQAGFPAEGKKIVELGYRNGALGTGPEAARHKRLQDLADKTAAADLKTMATGEADAARAKDGTAQVNLGYALVTAGQADKGIAMMEAGIAKGGLKRPDDARLHLGIAQLQAGRKPDAVKTLRSVQGTDGTADLARYWLIVANHPVA